MFTDARSNTIVPRFTLNRRAIIVMAGVLVGGAGLLAANLVGFETTWLTRHLGKAVILLCLARGYVLYRRERNEPLVQFNLLTLFAVLTAAALVAWAWRAGQGPLMIMLLASGSLIFWRVWIRRHERLSGLGMLALGGLSIYFLACSVLFGTWLLVGPAVQYDKPIGQPQGKLTVPDDWGGFFKRIARGTAQ
jgi:hypothetical protein